jgi:drug/metabolite transporter (DMT)-like permease
MKLYESMMTIIILLLFIAAACFEVFGDARIRDGLENKSPSSIIIGVLALCLYGFVINLGIYFNIVKWSFSKQLGTYVVMFAVISTIIGWRLFNDKISISHLIGLTLIIVGGIVIQLQKD